MEKQYLLKEGDFIKTFTKTQSEYLADYFKAKKLIDKKKGITKISKITGISVSRLNNWTRTNKKIPNALKCLIKTKNRGYFSIEMNSRQAESLAYLVGYNMGDGNIHRSLCNTWFYGHSEDFIEFDKLIKPFSVKGRIYVYKIHNGKMCISDNAFTHFMVALGCPIGDKTKSIFFIPKWILNTKKKSEIKRKFLQGLCDSELSNLKVIKRTRFAFQSLKFYSIKIEELVEEGKKYLNQIKDLMLEFRVATGETMVDRSYIRSRDNSKMVQLYFAVHSNYINLYNFISNIGFLYNKKRKNTTKKYLKKIKLLSQKELENIKKYKQGAIKRKKGLSAYKIAQKLKIPIHQAKNWFYRGTKPMFRYYLMD